MPAGVPKGEMPEKQTPSKDGNTEQDSSLADLTFETKTEEVEPDVTEEDLKEFSDSQKIPYNRFKEVNDKKKELESRLAELEANTQATLQSTIAQYEAKLQAGSRPQDDYGIVYEDDLPDAKTQALEDKIAKLTDRLEKVSSDYENNKTQTSLEKLKSRYKEADEMAVLGWSKVVPGASLEELMEKSHNENLARKEQAIKDLIASKKRKAAAVVPTVSRPTILPEDQRPKNLKEASAALKQFLADN